MSLHVGRIPGRGFGRLGDSCRSRIDDGRCVRRLRGAGGCGQGEGAAGVEGSACSGSALLALCFWRRTVGASHCAADPSAPASGSTRLVVLGLPADEPPRGADSRAGVREVGRFVPQPDRRRTVRSEASRRGWVWAGRGRGGSRGVGVLRFGAPRALLLAADGGRLTLRRRPLDSRLRIGSGARNGPPGGDADSRARWVPGRGFGRLGDSCRSRIDDGTVRSEASRRGWVWAGRGRGGRRGVGVLRFGAPRALLLAGAGGRLTLRRRPLDSRLRIGSGARNGPPRGDADSRARRVPGRGFGRLGDSCRSRIDDGRCVRRLRGAGGPGPGEVEGAGGIRGGFVRGRWRGGRGWLRRCGGR